MNLILKMEMTHVELIVIINMRVGSSSIQVLVKERAFKKESIFVLHPPTKNKKYDKSFFSLTRTGS